MNSATGKVFLVGAGPGDPGLLTVRGKECLERADVVLYDALSNEVLTEYAPKAEKIFAGKSPDKHMLLQEEINGLLIDLAKQGKRVVRLKGGDPFVFGRGGEEALALAENKIPFEVVPGVTAGIAVPAYAGIPITHRGLSMSCTFITGHDEHLLDDDEDDFAHIAAQGTLCFFMGVKNLPTLVRQVIALGRAPNTPAAVIAWGTLPKQRTIIATLETLEEVCAREMPAPPALVVIGDVVRLHEQLSWFESRPLFGKRIVVTRARTQAGELVRHLHELGADVFEFPTIEIEPAPIAEPFDYIGSYNWVVLTSVNGVEMLFERLEELGQDARDLAGVKLCAIGSATSEAVRKRFLNVDLMPEKYVAEDLLNALVQCEGALEGKRFLLPRADIARSFLPEELRKRGAEVTELVAYRTVTPTSSEEFAAQLAAYRPDLVTFTSSSTARNFAEILGAERLDAIKLGTRFASIGPITSKTAAELGMPVTVEPDTHDIPHFVDAIVQAFTQNR